MKINVATSLNEGYTPYTYVMLYSLFKNNTEHEFTVYLLTDGLSEESKRDFGALCARYHGRLIYLTVDPRVFGDRLLGSGEWTKEACFRLALFDLLPDDAERLIYLDGDIIVNKNIGPLYSKDFKDKHLLVCHDMTMTPDSEPVYGHLHTETFNKLIRENRYFNSGMIVMDTAYLKKHYSLRNYMALAQKLNYEIHAPDQDLLNYAHQDETLYVSEWEWDLFACNAFVRGYDYATVKRRVGVVHFVGEKPWNDGDHLHYDVEKLWWDYALETKFSGKFLDDFVKSSTADTYFLKKAYDLGRANASLEQDFQTIAKSFGELNDLRERMKNGQE